MSGPRITSPEEFKRFVPYVDGLRAAGQSWEDVAKALDGRIIVGQGDPPPTAEGVRRLYKEAKATKEVRPLQLAKDALYSIKYKNDKQREVWLSLMEKNTDPYGNAVCLYALRYGSLMERAITKLGWTLEEAAEKYLHLAHKGIGGGLSGAQANYAIKMLAQCWVHGDQFRRWWNNRSLDPEDAEKANATDNGIAQTHLLSIGGA